MKILLLNGSPRTGGNTDLILQQVAQGAAREGATVETIDLAKLSIHPCIGCGSCEQSGACIFDDDMAQLYDKIPTVERIVVGSPIYFYGVTAQTKSFIDRCQVFWSRKYILKNMSTVSPDRKGYFVSVAATRGDKVFDGASLTLHYAFDAMDVKYTDTLLIRGVDQKGAIATHIQELQRAQDFGKSLCKK